MTTYTSRSVADTARIAQTFAAGLSTGDCVLLSGDLGAGKTTFAAGCLAALGVTETVTSPTFSVANVYESATAGRVIHCDFYRLETAQDLLNTGVYELMDEAISLIEWGTKIPEVTYTHRIHFSVNNNERTLTISAE